MGNKKSDKETPLDSGISINRDLIPGASEGSVEVQITYNFILDLYERSKTLQGKEKQEVLEAINELTKHIGKWLIS